MNRHKLLLALFLVTAILATSCSQGKEAVTPSPAPGFAGKPVVKGTFIDGVSAGDAETLNFILAADSASFAYAGQTIDSLATFDNQFNVVPLLLAKDIEVSPDGLVYTVTIRNDLKWSNGSKVTAEDFAYTLKNLMFSDWLNFSYKSDWQEEVDGKTVYVEPRVVNETTFTITRKTVYPEFIYQIYPLSPYPKYIAQKYEGKVKEFTEAPEFNNLTYTGNLGPYKFSEWVRNDKFVVERNPDYYLGKPIGAPYFEKSVTKLFGTPATRHAALEAGDITETSIDPEQVNRFSKMPAINVYTTPTSSYTLLGFNFRDNSWAGFKNQKVRQAISMALSKETIIKSILLGFGDPAYSFIPKPSPWYSEESLAKYGVGSLYNKDKAKDLLVQAGFATKKADGTLDVKSKDGKPLKLTLVTNSGNAVRESVAFLVKQELSALGIEVEIKLIPWATLLNKYLKNKVPGSDQEPRDNNGPRAVSEEPWDLLIIGWISQPLSPSGNDVLFSTNGGLNFLGYSNSKVDELFAKARSKEALTKDARKRIYAELGKIISEDLPANFIAFPQANTGVKKTVKGIEPGINMGYNSYKWYFE